MGTDERSQSSCINFLENRGEECNFFQAVRLLENAREKNTDAATVNLRFKAVNSEAFHPNFIASIRHQAHSKNRQHFFVKRHINKLSSATITVNGFCLTGQQGPIPQCFSQMLRETETLGINGAEDPNDFINIFNDKLIGLLYQIKKTFDPMLFNEASTNSIIYSLFSSIAGLTTNDFTKKLPISPEQLTAFAPILANRRTDYSLLKNVLAQYFNCEIDISPNQGAWRKLPKKYQAKLSTKHMPSSRSLLGEGMGLGSKYWANQTAIGITLKVKSMEDCLSLLPSDFHEHTPKGENYDALCTLLSFLTDGNLLIYVTIILDWEAVPNSLLFPLAKFKLGQSSWLHANANLTQRVNNPQFMIMPNLSHDFSNDNHASQFHYDEQGDL